MKAISLLQPFPFPYLAGVCLGDGWVTKLSLGLRCKDQDFACAFAVALREVFGVQHLPRQDERGYWLIRCRNQSGRFFPLIGFEPQNNMERHSWLRGLFDSEGNATLVRKRKNHQYCRRISFYSTALHTLQRAAGYLQQSRISTGISSVKPSQGHKGTLPVFELRILGSKENYALFHQLIGSSIQRKAIVLAKIPGSYSDQKEYCTRGQLLGAKTKHRKTMEITLPKVVLGIQALLFSGVNPTQRACRVIPGYDSIQRWVPQADLIKMAKEASCVP